MNIIQKNAVTSPTDLARKLKGWSTLTSCAVPPLSHAFLLEAVIKIFPSWTYFFIVDFISFIGPVVLFNIAERPDCRAGSRSQVGGLPVERLDSSSGFSWSSRVERFRKT